MNNAHYPSLELCKKLMEAGFIWSARSQVLWTDKYVCPSVMELLDEIPKKIVYWTEGYFSIKKLDFYIVWYSFDNWQVSFSWTLPNALAEMWLWLKENNYVKHD